MSASSASSSASSSSATPLSKLRELLGSHNLAAYIVPSADAHQSEYVADCDKRRAFISSFTGSAGTAVVLADPGKKSLLWTDGRYFLQANAQLSSEWTLMKDRLPETPKIEEWLVKNLPSNSAVGVDPSVFSISQWKSFESAFKGKLQLKAITPNLVDIAWGSSRPSRPSSPIFIHPSSYSGEETSSKLSKIRSKMSEQGVSTLVIAALDEIAWLFNLRGADIPFNPVFFGYGLVTANKAVLYVDPSKINKQVIDHLGKDVEIRNYNEIVDNLKNEITPTLSVEGAKIWMDAGKTPSHLYHIFSNSIDLIYDESGPIALLKAVKNEVELEGMRVAHIKDGAAMASFLSWLEDEIKVNERLDEVTIADKLEWFRAQQPDFVGLSFETISGVGPSGSIIHYKAEKETARKLDDKQILLLDSGAQFRDGTTDITRTIHLGTPTDWERTTFTLVLQGHIDLADAIFPPSTVGPTLDAFARSNLWRNGLDYLHGTGHGVGSFLNVHEGPHGISSQSRAHSILNTSLQVGMIVSNEPGYYEDGKFGIRIESLVIVQPKKTPHQFQARQFLGFETITMVPIQRKMIKVDMLTDRQLEWLNQYHIECRKKVLPCLTEPRAQEWLVRNTEPITREHPRPRTPKSKLEQELDQDIRIATRLE